MEHRSTRRTGTLTGNGNLYSGSDLLSPVFYRVFFDQDFTLIVAGIDADEVPGAIRISGTVRPARRLSIQPDGFGELVLSLEDGRGLVIVLEGRLSSEPRSPIAFKAAGPPLTPAELKSLIAPNQL